MHTSYYDNFSQLKNEEGLHTGDIDLSIWCTNPDHDVIMTLHAFRTKLPPRLASLHVYVHQDGNCEFNLLSRPAQLNVLADDLTSEVLELSEQLTNLLSSTRYPPSAPITPRLLAGRTIILGAQDGMKGFRQVSCHSIVFGHGEVGGANGFLVEMRLRGL